MELQNAVFKYLGLSPDIVDGVYREPKKTLPMPQNEVQYTGKRAVKCTQSYVC